MENIKRNLDRWKSSTSILFLGQDYLRLGNTVNEFVEQLKLKNMIVGDSNYQVLLDKKLGDTHKAIIEMQEICKNIKVNWELEEIAKFPWSSIFTSAVDNVIIRNFRTQYREFHTICTDKDWPHNYCSKSRLHGTFIFGNIIEEATNDIPPLADMIMFARKKREAINLLSRIEQIITPFGTLIIDGYNPKEDWIKIEDWFPILDRLNVGQIHFFSFKEEYREYYLDYLIQEGKVICHADSLANYLFIGEKEGFINLDSVDGFSDTECRTVTLKDKVISIDRKKWNDISEVAEILDDSISVVPRQISNYKKYEEYRRFLADSSTQACWVAYGRKFNFIRDFQNKLEISIKRYLSSSNIDMPPILVAGQTGIGKTVALRGIAYKLKKENMCPIIFISNKINKIVYEEIDIFCNWLEKQGVEKTLIIWDGMLTPESSYIELNNFLIGRGRKVIIVGSCYNDENSSIQESDAVVQVPIVIRGKERDRFYSYLKEVDEDINEYIVANNIFVNQLDNNFLVSLYRLLPDTRGSLRKGLSREVEHTEKKIFKELQNEDSMIYMNDIAIQLLKNKLVSQQQILETILDKDCQGKYNLNLIIYLVMVPGQFGFSIPLELLLRTIGNGFSQEIVQLIEKVDLFRCIEDNLGNSYIAPRHTLEAKIIVENLHDLHKEIEYIKNIILNVKDGGYQNDIEIQFIVNLIKYIGPNSKVDNPYKNYYSEISEVLQKLRETRNIENDSLMVQESMFLRESLRTSNCDKNINEKIDVLVKGEEILRRILDNRGGLSPKFESSILIELASNLGYKSKEMIKSETELNLCKTNFEQIKKILSKAKVLDPNTDHVIDVMLWVTRDILSGYEGNDINWKLEVQNEALHTIEKAESEEDIDRIENFESNKHRIYKIIKETELEEDAFNKLLEMKSSLGIYVNACKQIETINGQKEKNIDFMSEQYMEVVEYINGYQDKFKLDGRTQYLRLKYWWKSKVKKDFFEGERQRIGFNEEEWRYAFELINNLLNLEEQYNTPTLKYLKGLCEFHLGDIRACLNTFAELREYKLASSRRIKKSHIASKRNGEAMKFNGKIVSVGKDKGKIYVEELNENIIFFKSTFENREIKERDSISGFHIAFNLIGLTVDSPNMI